MNVFSAKLNINYGNIIQGMNQVGRTIRNFGSIVGARPTAYKAPDISGMMGDVGKLQNLMKELAKPMALPAVSPMPSMPSLPSISMAQVPVPPAFGGVTTGTQYRGRVGLAQATIALSNIQKAFNEKDLSSFRKSFGSLREVMSQNTFAWKKMRPELLAAYSGMKRHVGSLEKYNKEVEASAKVFREARHVMGKVAKNMRKEVSGQIWGRVPVVGGIMGAFRGGAGQAAQLRETFATLKEAGAPVSRITRSIGILQTAIGPLGTILGLVKNIGVGFVRLGRSVFSLSVRLVKMPISIMWSIHRIVQSITFSFMMFAHMFQRFFKDAIPVVKDVQVATLLASGSLDTYGESLSYVLGLSTKYAISTANIAKGFLKITKAGFSAAEAQDVLNASIKFATIFQMGLSEATDQVIKVLRAYGIAASKSEEVTRMLLNAVKSTNASLPDLNTALGYAAAQAASMGMSLEHTLVVMGAFIDMGLRASRAGMAFRSGMSGLERAIGLAAGVTMDLKKATKVLAVDWEKLQKSGSDFTVMFREFNKVVADGVSLEERLAFRAVFGQRYFAQYIRLFQQSEASFRKRMQDIQATTKLTALAEKMSESLIGVIQRLQNVWTIFKIGFLEELRTPFEDIGNSIKGLQEMAESFGKTLGSLAKSRLLAPLVAYFKELTKPEGMKGLQEFLSTFAERVGFWMDRIRKSAGKLSSEIFSGGTKNWVLDIANIIFYLFEQSIEVSRTMITAFKSLDTGSIQELIAYATSFLKTTMPGALKLLFMFLEGITKIIDFLLPSLGISDMVKDTMNEISAGLKKSKIEAMIAVSEIGGEAERKMEKLHKLILEYKAWQAEVLSKERIMEEQPLIGGWLRVHSREDRERLKMLREGYTKATRDLNLFALAVKKATSSVDVDGKQAVDAMNQQGP